MSSASSILHISGIAKAKLRALRAKAKKAGMTPEKYAKRLIEQSVSIGNRKPTTTIDELFAPVREQFRKSGMTTDEFDGLIDAARTEHYKRVTKRKS
jgi:hypothetical protein